MSAKPIELADAPARARITRDGLDELLFVEAGAGTGKTHELVERVIGLVASGVPLREIAAITFTIAAASELGERVRETLERLAVTSDSEEVRARCEEALAEADIAAIGTLHSFASRILSEHPIEIGLPPRIDVLDEISSQLEFQERWETFVDILLAQPALEEVITRAVWLNVHIDHKYKASLRDVAIVFARNWDRLDAIILDSPALRPINRARMIDAVTEVRALWPIPDVPADVLVQHLANKQASIDHVAHLLDNATDHELVRALRDPIKWKNRNGKKGNWDDVEYVRETLKEAEEAWEELKNNAVDDVLRTFAVELARFTLQAAEERRAEGHLEFHDLLVLARKLLRTSPVSRQAIHDRYTRLLLDEFQDTDPIQIELAVLIAKVPDESEEELTGPWADVSVELERLFFVGDPKQSIYRFRRADIQLFLAARDAYGGNDPVPLVTNFRSVPTILSWVNTVFGQVMEVERSGQQPAYEPLLAHREDGAGDHRIALLGGPHKKEEHLNADAVRTLEANDVAAAIGAIEFSPNQWPVFDKAEGTWRDARLSDIAILLPARTSLPFLRQALDRMRIPYRAEIGVPVYESQEVRDLISILRVIADPADEIALVAALRSPAMACGDDDLWEFVAAGGRWDVRRKPPASLHAEHPVVAALVWLRGLHEDRWWLEPSALLARVIRERRCFELAFAQPRPRDVWRRLRYLLDQARLFAESQGGDLLGFLEWTDLQAGDASRVSEPVLPETDDDAVRILTVHGAKGLEFPIVVLSGLGGKKQSGNRGIGVHWDANGGVEIKMSKDTATSNFLMLADIDAEMNDHEKQRLLYVACTRARDYLIASVHHPEDQACFAKTLWALSEDVMDKTCRVWQAGYELPDIMEAGPLPASHLDAEDLDEARSSWLDARRSLLDAHRHSRSISPTAIARATAASLAADAEIEDDTEDLGDVGADSSSASISDAGFASVLQWRPGRAGTAIGKAVHAVLESVDLATGEGTDGLAKAQALLEGIPDRANDVATLVRRALDTPIIRTAAAGEYWRECYVAVPAGDRVLEGYLDLLVRTPAGLVVVDYKTDTVRNEREALERVARYRLQGAAYAVAIEIAAGEPVVDCVFVFTSTATAIEKSVEDLDAAKAEVREFLAG
ncbi:MAG: DNA helicase UvrD [Acidimicrobiia bacterium]|nr:DNA helicase UvrD [Acidimicrobiia bacterium]